MFSKIFRRKKDGSDRALDDVPPNVTAAKTKIVSTTTTTTTTASAASPRVGVPLPKPASSSVSTAPDAHVVTTARGLRVPITFWLIGYSTLSMLPKAIGNDALLARYVPGAVVVGLGRGELAYEPLFVLSGVAAGTQLAAVIPEGKDIPDRWTLIKFWTSKVGAVLPAVGSLLFSLAISVFRGERGIEQSAARKANLFAVLTDCAFYLAAPFAFKALRTSDRGAAPRLAIGTSIIAGVLSFIGSTRLGLRPSVVTSKAVPFAFALSPARNSFVSSIPLRFPAFFAGLALAAERQRSDKGRGPSVTNQVVGAVASAVIWSALLFVPPGFGEPQFIQIFNAFRYPAAALATYLALRPIIAVPKEESLTSPWRVKLHAVLTHPTTEAISTVITTAEAVHREVITFVFYAARQAGIIDRMSLTAGELTDVKVVGVYAVVVLVSLGVGVAVHRILQTPALKQVKECWDKQTPTILLAVSIGNPFETVHVAGAAIPRYRVAAGVFATFFGLYVANKTYKSFQPRAAIEFGSKEEENYVKRYIHHHHQEAHSKPAFIRETYQGPSGQL
ncbi:hypothetical protein HDU80_003276 [Chytriomyces hyalinus]|nr:hypothetical protein HDU80_003276 [Chytriomyces hyalinus]